MFSSKRLYLRDLPETASEDEIEAFLAPYGKITEVKLVSGHSYGFVEFESLDDARTVLETFKEKDFLCKRITIEFAHPLRKDVAALADTSNLARNECVPRGMRFPVAVAGIPRHVCWQELKDFGRLSGHHVAYCDIDRKNRSKGFIEFSSYEEAELAVEKLDGQTLGGVPVKVSIRKPSYLREAKEVSHSRGSSPIRRHPAYMGADDRRGAARSPDANRTLPMRYPSPLRSYPSCSSYNTDPGPYSPRIQDRYDPVLEYSRDNSWDHAQRYERDERCRDYNYDYDYDYYHYAPRRPPMDYYFSSDRDNAEYRRWYNLRYAYY